MSAPTATPSRPAPQVATPAYYAEGLKVWKAPIRNDKPDGSTSITIGFQACHATEIIGEEGAAAIAVMLCAAEQHEGLLKALRASRDAIRKIAFVAHRQSLTNEERVSDIASVSDLALTAVEAALALAQGAAPAGEEG